MRVLGIDPGSRVTGIAVIEKTDAGLRILSCEALRLATHEEHADRLTEIYRAVQAAVKEHSPVFAAIETPVYGSDPSAMLKLGRAQAAAILAVRNLSIDIHEFYPKAVKKAVTGNGNATKEQVAYMLRTFLPGQPLPESKDLTDALAVALCAWMHHDRPALGQGGAQGEGSSPRPSLRSKGGARANTWEAFVKDNPDRLRTS